MGAVRILAGFNSHSSREQYHIARDTLQPPDSLLRQVFPDIDKLIEQHDDISETSPVEQSVTARGTLRALKYLRKVFIQDSVFLRDKEGWRHLSALWSHAIFEDSAYLLYAEQLKQACSAPEVVNPSAARIDPYTREYFDGHVRSLQDNLAVLSHMIATSVASKEDVRQVHVAIADLQRRQTELIRSFNAGHVMEPRLRVLDRPESQSQSESESLAQCQPQSPLLSPLRSQLPTGPTTSTLPIFHNVDAMQIDVATPAQPPRDPERFYGMAHATKTIQHLYWEWTQDYFLPGRLSVEKHGSEIRRK
jgi:hypothetical protein